MKTPEMNTVAEFVKAFTETYPMDADARLSLRNCMEGRERWHEQAAQQRIEAARQDGFGFGLRMAAQIARRWHDDNTVGLDGKVLDGITGAIERAADAVIEEAAKR